jgi:hypothetical protein
VVSITVNTSGIVDGQNIDAADVTTPIANLKTAVEDTLNGAQGFDQINLGASSEVTIAGGAIAISRSHHRVDTEANAASDDLDTISGGAEGDVLMVRLENAARVVTVRHNTGNVHLSNARDVTLSSANQVLRLFYTGTRWVDVTASQPAPAAAGPETILARTVLGTAVPSITIASIPQTYNHLKLILEARTSNSGFFWVRLNGDTTASNYYMQSSALNASGSFLERLGTEQGWLLQQWATPDLSAPAGSFGLTEMLLANYQSVTQMRHMVAQGHSHFDTTANNQRTLLASGAYRAIGSPVTSIDIVTSAGSFVVGTAWTLIGIP